MCVALPGRDYNLPTRVGIPTLYLVATPSFLVVRVSRFAWLLSARDHYADPEVLSRGDVTPAYVDGHAHRSRWGWDTCFLGSGFPPPTPAYVAGLGAPSRVTTTVKTKMPGPAVARTRASNGKQEWTPTSASPSRRDASGVPPDVASSPAVMSFLESLREELRADMAGAVETLTSGRTSGMMASPSAGLGPSGNRVVTVGGGGDDGGPDGSTSGDSRRDRRWLRSRRNNRRRRPRSSSGNSSSRSDWETVRRTLVDFQIPVHKVGENLLNTVTDWPSYLLDNQNHTFTSRMRLRITQYRKKRRVSMDRVSFDWTRPAEIFSFLRRFLRACNDGNVWEGKALYLVGSFLIRAAALRFNKILPDTAVHNPGRTVASFPEAVHWLLVNYADSITLNHAVSDVNRASLGAQDVPDAFAARLRDVGEACGNVYGEDRLMMAFIQGIPKHLQVDAQQ